MTRRTPVLAAAASLTALALAQLVGALPAHAGTPTFTFHSPQQAGFVFTAEGVTVDITAGMNESNGNLVGDIVTRFSSPDGRPIETAELRVASDNARSKRVTHPVTFRWNGNYVVHVTARGRSSFLDSNTPELTDQRSFAVDANPKPPTGVKTAVDSKTRYVTISWAANTEPDLAGYVVEKQGSGGRWNELGATTKTSVVDESSADAGGTHTYRVRALRRSAAANRLNQSDSTTASAKVPAPPVTTTTTPAGGVDGGEEGEEGGEGETGRGEQGTGGTRTGSTGGATTGAGSNGSSGSGPTLGTGGKVDLSDFQALLAEAERNGTQPPGLAGEGEDDGTYDPTLPFGGRNRADGDAEEGEGDEGSVIGEDLGEERTVNEYSLALLAGGLLATVLAMVVLWIRSEVNRAEKLDVLAPEDRTPVSAEARFGFRDVGARDGADGVTGDLTDAAAPAAVVAEGPTAPSARTRRRRPSPVAH